MAFELKQRYASVNKTIRFPLPLVDRINAAVGEEASFSSFVIQACEYALENMTHEEDAAEK